MAEARLRQTGVRKIASPTNTLVKVFRGALREGVTREGWLATEGPLLLGEALEAYGTPEGNGPNRGGVRTVLLSESAAGKFEGLIRGLPGHVELAQVPDRLFEQLSQTETPQGVAALVELARPTLDTVLTENACLLVACGVQDPGNLGTMMRSAQALGGTALLTLRETVSPFNPKSVRSSAGAIFRLPVLGNLQAGELFPKLRSAGVTIIAADRHSSDSVVRASLCGGVAFLVGREARGLEEDLLREARRRLSIPIRSGTDSLNAAVAATIFLYEAARQRGFKY
jgi:TrmH family RNA methyltransferase